MDRVVSSNQEQEAASSLTNFQLVPRECAETQTLKASVDSAGPGD